MLRLEDLIIMPKPEKIEDIMAKLFPDHTAEEWKDLFPVMKKEIEEC